MQANAKHAHLDFIRTSEAKRFVFNVFLDSTKTPPPKQPAKHARPIGIPTKPNKRNAKPVAQPKGPTRAARFAASARPACT
jgi:hypothetical protein